MNQPVEMQIVLAMEGEVLVGWLMVTYSEKHNLNHFSMLDHGDYQYKGIGSQLISIAKKHYNELYGVVIPVNIYTKRDGSTYLSPLKFYEKNGFHLTGRKMVE